MARFTRTALTLLLTGLMLMLASGCGEPNDPDVPSATGVYTILGELQSRGFARDFGLVGDTLFVAENSVGVTLYDISDLANPVLLDTIETIGVALHVAVAPSINAVLYSSGDFTFARQIEEEFAADNNGQFGSGGIRDLIAAPKRLTVSSDFEAGLLVEADVARVIRVDRNDGLHVNNIYPDSTHIPGGDTTYYFQIQDEPIELAWGTLQPASVSMAPSIDTVACALFDLGVAFADVSPAAEGQDGAWISNVDTPGEATSTTYKNGYLYVADGFAGLSVIDARDIDNPVYLSSYDLAGSNHVYEVAVYGDYCAVADEFDGVIFFDISDPSNPVYRGTFDTREINTLLFDSEGRLFVGSNTRGITILELTF